MQRMESNGLLFGVEADSECINSAKEIHKELLASKELRLRPGSNVAEEIQAGIREENFVS